MLLLLLPFSLFLSECVLLKSINMAMFHNLPLLTTLSLGGSDGSNVPEGDAPSPSRVVSPLTVKVTRGGVVACDPTNPCRVLPSPLKRQANHGAPTRVRQTRLLAGPGIEPRSTVCNCKKPVPAPKYVRCVISKLISMKCAHLCCKQGALKCACVSVYM